MTLRFLDSAALVMKDVQLFAPESCGRTSIASIYGKIVSTKAETAELVEQFPNVEVINAGGLRLIPGLIDQHIHFVGGGDANGPLGRVSELTAEMLFEGGTTTAVGLLGVDNDTRDLRLLLRKAHELRAKGLSAYIYTGGMPLPARHLLQDVCADVAFIDQVIGAKTAVAEKLHPNRDWNDLADLAGQLMRARYMSGKAAVLHCHIGSLPEGLHPLERLIDELDMPRDQIVPTHVNRTADFSPIFEQAINFARNGGTIDMTCCVSKLDGNLTGIDIPDAIEQCLRNGIKTDNITISTDGNIPAAVRDKDGKLLRYHTVSPSVLWRDIIRLTQSRVLPFDQALSLATTNVARVLGIGHLKGRIAEGFDADFSLIDDENTIQLVVAGGRIVYRAAESF